MVAGRFEGAGTTEDYAGVQHNCAPMVAGFLRRRIDRGTCRDVLDVGCGVGASAASLAVMGLNVWGVDLPNVTPLWAAAGRNSERFVAASALRLPFASDSFDFVYSLGVIEHIGTLTGHCALAPDYEEQRKEYAKEIVRVTRPGGRILIACPNKGFPIDIQHGPGDRIESAGPFRTFIHSRTGMNVHRTWGRYHLPSYRDVKALFRGGGVRNFSPLPLEGYFEFGRFKKGFLRPFYKAAEFWVNNLPRPVRATFLNPYLMLEIRK